MCTLAMDRPVKELNSQEFDYMNDNAITLNWDFIEDRNSNEEHGLKMKYIDLKNELKNFMANSDLSSYSVKVGEIKQDYLSGMLRQLLEIAYQIGIKEIRLTCLNNIPSLQIITQKSGIYVNSLRDVEKVAETYIVKI